MFLPENFGTRGIKNATAYFRSCEELYNYTLSYALHLVRMYYIHIVCLAGGLKLIDQQGNLLNFLGRNLQK